MKKNILLLSVMLMIVWTGAWGQVSLTTIGAAQTQNFNGLATSGTSNTWTDNSTISGWYSNRTVYIADAGTNTTGGLHSYGTGTDAERSLGGLSSGSTSPTWAIRLVNNTGSTITSLDVSYTGEQWRQTANAQSITFDYQVGASDISTGSWTSVSALNFTAPHTGTAGALDGNASGNFTSISSTISVTITNGQEIWLRWSKAGSTSPGLGVDDFSVTPLASATPSIGVAPNSLSGFTYVEGSGPSTSQSYNLSGTNLTGVPGNITVTGSTNYEVSTDNSSFSSSVNVAYASATLGATPVYVRLKSGLTAGNYNSETISNAGGGATTQNVTASGTIYKAEATNHATSFSSSLGSPAYGTINLSWTDATGGTVPDGYLIKGSSVGFGSITNPVDGTAESDGALVQNVAAAVGAASFTGLEANTTYYFKLYPYTNTGTNINFKTDGSAPQSNATTDVAPAAALLLNENFDYTASENLTAHNWTAHSGGGTNPITVNNAGLTITGYPSVLGNAALIDNTGEDDNRTFTEQTAGTVYVSFLVNASASADYDDYFFHLSTNPFSTSLFRGKVFTKVTGTVLQFGLSVGSNTGSYSATNYVLGTTYLLVLKYRIFTGPANNAVSLFIFENGEDFSTEPGSPDIGPLTDAAQSDLNPGAIALRQFSANENIIVDGIRVATGWLEAPMPVELTSFTAVAKGKVVELAWQTATEVNNHGFAVERKTIDNGKLTIENWKQIGFVAGNGTTDSPKWYSFVDATAKGNISYRLKQVDNDGKFEYSNEVEVMISQMPQMFALMQNSPNPFNPTTKIGFALPVSGFVSLKIYDMLGREVQTLVNEATEAGEHAAKFNASQYPSGIYFYTLRTSNFTATKKMLLMK